jgi:multidrug efflux pump subunit AcrA (membrane-fusion protein)
VKHALVAWLLAGAVAGGSLLARGWFGGGTGTDVPVLKVAAGPFTRTVSAEGYLKPVKATPITAPRAGRAQIIAWLAADGATVKKGDLLVRFDNDEALRALADGKNDRETALTRIRSEQLQIDSAINERTRTASLTKEEIKQVKDLGKKDPRFFPRNEVIESEIDEGLLQARLRQTEVAKTVEKKLGHSRVELLAVDRQRADTETAKAERLLQAMEIRAPHDGTFVVQRMGWGQRMVQAGDRAFSGMRVAEVATTARMDADVAVLEADAGGLVAGKRATVVLDARPDVVWKAKVKKVDPFPKPKHPEVPAQYFGSLLEIEGSTVGVKPGQRLQATIVLDEVPQGIAVPRQTIFRNESGNFVYRLRAGGGFETVPVTLGPGTVGRVVVTAGLKSGDQVALRDPTRSAAEMVSSDPAGKQSPAGARP